VWTDFGTLSAEASFGVEVERSLSRRHSWLKQVEKARKLGQVGRLGDEIARLLIANALEATRAE
jgi:hypothetical protein